MYKPDLDLQSAIDEVAPTRMFQWDLDQSSPFVTGMHEFDEALNAAIESGEIKGDVHVHQQERQWSGDMRRAYRKSWGDMEGNGLMDFLRVSLNWREGWEEVFFLVYELIGNALIHGTAWCTKGDVMIRGVTNWEYKVVLTVNQSATNEAERAVAFEKIKKNLSLPPDSDEDAYPDKHGMIHGQGLRSLRRAPEVKANVMRTQDSIAIILATL